MKVLIYQCDQKIAINLIGKLIDKERCSLSRTETPGHPFNKPTVELFKTFCNSPDGPTELNTIVELHEKLRTFAGNYDLYSIKCLTKS